MRLGWLVTAAGTAALLAPGAALAGFSPNVLEVSGDFMNDVFPVVDTAPGGQSVVVWTETTASSSVLRARRVLPDGTMTAPVAVSDGTLIVTQRDVAYTSDGRALVIWTESANGAAPRSLRARWMSADGTLGAQISLRDAAAGTVTADEPGLVATTDGDAVVAWRNSLSTPAGRVEARRVDASGTLGTLLEPPDGPNVGTGVPVVPLPGGGALLAWRAPPGIATMPVDAAGAAGAVKIPVASGVLGGPRLSAGAGGAIRMIWPSNSPASEATVALDTTGAPATAVQAVDGEASSFAAQIATDLSGRTLALWTRASGIAARFLAPDGTPEATTFTAPAAGQIQFSADAALLDDGTGVLLWSQGAPAQPRGLVSRVIAPDGSAGDLATLAAISEQAEFSVTSGGVGLVAWQDRATGSGPRRVRARQFLPVPVCPDASATAVQGQPVTVALACQGLQLQAPELLTPPANGTLGAVDGPAGRVLYTPRPGFDGIDTFTFRGRNPGGAGTVQTARVGVGRDSVAPRITRFRLNVATVRLRSSFRRPPARRPAFALGVSEPARLTVTVLRKRRATFRGFRALPATEPLTSASVRLAKRGLVPGSYRATVVATDLAGNRSAPRRIGFVVRRG